MEEIKRVSKQVLVIRKDLNMRKGKMVAQGAHASMSAILSQMKSISGTNLGKPETKELIVYPYSAVDDWLNGRFTKICVSVNSEAELDEVYNKAKSKGLICSIITDAGLTEFAGVPTKTCCSIGPVWSDEVDEITGKLPLL